MQLKRLAVLGLDQVAPPNGKQCADYFADCPTVSRPGRIRGTSFLFSEGMLHMGVDGWIYWVSAFDVPGERWQVGPRWSSREMPSELSCVLNQAVIDQVPFIDDMGDNECVPLLPDEYFWQGHSHESFYNEMNRQVFQIAGRWIDQMGLTLGRRPRIFVPGCADGTLCALLQSDGVDAWGMDLCSIYEGQWRDSLLKNMSIGNAYQTAFDDGFFDAVLAVGIGTRYITGSYEVSAFLAEVQRLLGKAQHDIDKLFVWTGKTPLTLPTGFGHRPPSLLLDPTFFVMEHSRMIRWEAPVRGGIVPRSHRKQWLTAFRRPDSE